VGAKAAALAAARSAGAPVLPGFVVVADASRSHLELGARTLPERGSGGARLVVTGAPIDFADALVAAGEDLDDRLVARSSTLLESSGEWSGAFTSYVDVTPAELPKAVVGCWASAFSVAALERQEAAGVAPGTFPMSVLVQPALQPEAGGSAELGSDGRTTVNGIKGAPAPLLQGWATGHEARYDHGWSGDALIEMLGVPNLEAIRHILATTGANRCEWALTDRIWALQLGRARSVPEPVVSGRVGSEISARLVELARTLVLAPGPLGEVMVLPWALAGIPEVAPTRVAAGSQTAGHSRALCRELTEEVWGLPFEQAVAATRDIMGDLGGPDPGSALSRLRRLRPAEASKSGLLMGSLRALRVELAERGLVVDQEAAWHLDLDSIEAALGGRRVMIPPRVGIGRWEPLVASVILSSSTPRGGTPASPGVGVGRRAHVADVYGRQTHRRNTITAPQPIPNLASLLWDAAALVTATGSPAAHLFEAARALRVPAVCGIDLGPARAEVVAVDGHHGMVATLTLDREL